MILIISWPSGVGKTTTWELYLQMYPQTSLKKVITTTTRSPRPHEVDGKDYYFVTPEEFEKKIKAWAMIEYAQFAGNRYGSDYEQLDQLINDGCVPVFIVDHQWVKNFRELFDGHYDFKTILMVPPQFETLRQRLLHRSTDSDEVIQKRIANAQEQLDEKNLYDYVFVNDELKKAVEDFNNIIQTILLWKKSS